MKGYSVQVSSGKREPLLGAFDDRYWPVAMYFECPLFGRDRAKRKSCATNRAERTRSARLGSEVDLFRYGKGVIDLNAEISDGALDLGVAEQKLHGS
jgi:hypothetical protein